MRPKRWTVAGLLKVTADYLKKNHIESPRLTAEVLLAHQLDLDRVSLYLNFDRPLTEKELSGYRSVITRRLRREPVQYITGVQEFWSLEFMVNPHVLIPRHETELLIELTLGRIRANPDFKNRLIKILDLGTGCGALSVTLAKEVEKAQIRSTDVSAKAIELARLNAKKHSVSNICFVRGDLFDPVKNKDSSFDFIISNPPYIACEEYHRLQPEVRDYEPRVALDGRKGGVYYIEKIIKEAPNHIVPGGWILLEMAPGQTEWAIKLMKENNAYKEIRRVMDYGHRYRVVMACKAK